MSRTALSPYLARVLTLQARGYAAKDIARELGYSARAVDQYAFRVRECLGAATTAQAVAIGLTRGLIRYEEEE